MTGPFREVSELSHYKMWPELLPYRDKCHMVYASLHYDHTIMLRSFEEVIEEVRQARANGKTKIIFHNLPETVMPDLMRRVQRIVEHLTDISTDDMFFTTSAPYGQEAYNQLADEHNWTRRIRVLSAHNFEMVMRDAIANIDRHMGEYQIKRKSRNFVCFNKVHRHHRVEVLMRLLSLGLVEKSYYSFEGAGKNWVDDYVKWRPINQELRSFIPQLEQIRDKFPMRLNITPERCNPVDLALSDFIYHEDSYFSIVTETIFYKRPTERIVFLNYSNTLFISEKTYKAMGMKHPFLIVGWPGTIKHLKERGFKTFSPYINESYDDIEDDDMRMDAIIKEIQRLCAQTPEQWIRWQIKVKDIVEHNYQLLRDRTDFRVTYPVDKFFE